MWQFTDMPPSGGYQQLNLTMASHSMHPHPPPPRITARNVEAPSLRGWGHSLLRGTGPHLGKVVSSCVTIIERPRTKRGSWRPAFPLLTILLAPCTVGRDVSRDKADRDPQFKDFLLLLFFHLKGGGTVKRNMGVYISWNPELQMRKTIHQKCP